VSHSQHNYVLFNNSKELHFPTISTYFQESLIVKAKKVPNIQVCTALVSRVYNIMSLGAAKINKFKNYVNFHMCEPH